MESATADAVNEEGDAWLELRLDKVKRNEKRRRKARADMLARTVSARERARTAAAQAQAAAHEDDTARAAAELASVRAEIQRHKDRRPYVSRLKKENTRRAASTPSASGAAVNDCAADDHGSDDSGGLLELERDFTYKELLDRAYGLLYKDCPWRIRRQETRRRMRLCQ